MAEAGYVETRGQLEDALRALTALADERFGPPIADGTRTLLKKLAEELFNVGVERAVLYSPAGELRDGVFLVATPGVGSVYRHNTEAAYAFVPESDAAVFLSSADPPISEGERAFLEDVRAEAARMFFVLNKVDYLSEKDRDEALAFTQDVLTGALGTRPKLYPISARQALVAKLVGNEAELEASGLAEFERDF